MAVKNRENLQEALKRLESETIEQGQENVPLVPVNFEFHPLTEKDKKEFKSFRLPENEDCGLTRVLSELDSKEHINPVKGDISNSQPDQNYPIWPRAVIAFALGLTAAWLIFIGYGLIRLVVGAI